MLGASLPTQVITKDRESLNKLVTQGNSIRRVAETKMNSASSRSHSVFTIKVEKRTVTTDEGERAKRESLDEERREYSRWIPRNGYRHNGYIRY